MSIIIFIIILGILVFVHELGHFLVAKKNKIRVDEFGIGYPPRVVKLFRRWGTDFTLNAIPFGGFVKIFGESPDSDSISGPDSDKSLVNASKLSQISVLFAGVFFNLLFAWILISIGFISGLPTTLDSRLGSYVTDSKVVVTGIIEESPAELAGFKVGDVISSISNEGTSEQVSPQVVSDFIASNGSSEIEFGIKRGEDNFNFLVMPETGIVEDRSAIGISMDMIGLAKLPISKAFIEGGRLTGELTVGITKSVAIFIWQAIRGEADLSGISGPVGIVGLVGDASSLGLIYILSFTAFISIHLAIINMIPFPALDGGRILFILIEAITRRPIKPQIVNALNGAGFLLLILLMIVITWNDIANLF